VDKTVDSYRFISSGITKRMIKTWIGMEKPGAIPWTPLAKPLADSTVPPTAQAGMIEPLTRRELQDLELLAQRMTAQELRRSWSCLTRP